jgi:hypothetical protein
MNLLHYAEEKPERKSMEKSTVRIGLAILAIALVVGLAACGGGDSESEVTTTDDGFKQVEAIDMVFEWQVDGDNLNVRLEAPATGWVGVGFDPDSIMKGANFLMGYVVDGQATVEDHWGDGLTTHVKDDEQNVSSVQGSESDGTTSLSFTIPLDSGNDQDKPLTEGETYDVLLAYSGADDFVTEHEQSERKKVEITL